MHAGWIIGEPLSLINSLTTNAKFSPGQIMINTNNGINKAISAYVNPIIVYINPKQNYNLIKLIFTALCT